jgi:hypothetical protein
MLMDCWHITAQRLGSFLEPHMMTVKCMAGQHIMAVAGVGMILSHAREIKLGSDCTARTVPRFMQRNNVP